jgi:dihydroceramidase
LTRLTPGFWGPPTSTIDWCERNYALFAHVAEAFNTVSSLALVGSGILGVALHRGHVEARFLLAFASVAVVGLGSVAFHGTLLFPLQLLDELPMLWTVLLMVFILLENRTKPKQLRFGRWFPALLIAHGALITTLTAGFRGDMQFYLFHISFGSLEVFALWRVSLVYKRWRHKAHVGMLFFTGLSFYLGGVGVWFLDLMYCPFFEVQLPALGLFNPQLHAWWHVAVSVGFYQLLLLMMVERALARGEVPVVARFGGLGLKLLPPRPL